MNEPRSTASSAQEDILSTLKERPAGRLKIYIGSAAGVGKTYQMLLEAQRLRSEGVDVVLGYIETHNRAETAALVGDLEKVPLRRIRYQDRLFDEMNLPAILERRPQIVVVDELAHSNIPGTEHPKRYQDVEDILKAGINVISAVNIQHIESLNPYVERLTGVKVRETVPDRVLALASEIINIDLSVEDHRERLRRGKIYPTEKVESALRGFFTPENLAAMREMALREVASKVEYQTEEQRLLREAGPLRRLERVVVCLGPDHAANVALLRRGARVAGRLNADWFAVTVVRPELAPGKALSPVRKEFLKLERLAEELGARFEVLEAHSVLDALVSFVEEHGITLAIFGKNRHVGWRLRMFKWLTLEFLNHTEGVDVQIVDTDERDASARN
ncbi:sensor histidine kinase KdpD [Acidiferrobacter sp.]|uniref:sensor histidine kinase KdpD n=2 Tax=Acidiferrobacter sp. TaxID=1872107 RepID=UPI0026244CEF|nr:sensor histidine kinase KdpD [Acidiferrobacter sp.]